MNILYIQHRTAVQLRNISTSLKASTLHKGMFSHAPSVITLIIVLNEVENTDCIFICNVIYVFTSFILLCPGFNQNDLKSTYGYTVEEQAGGPGDAFTVSQEAHVHTQQVFITAC